MPDPLVTPLLVLVVDDYPGAADSVAELLRLLGHRTVVARTGAAALEQAAADPPDVVLLDLRLPDVDGWEVAKRLRERMTAPGRRPLIVALTGCNANADRARSASAGIDLHLAKGTDPAVLGGVLRRFQRLIAEPGGWTAPRPSDVDTPTPKLGLCGGRPVAHLYPGESGE